MKEAPKSEKSGLAGPDRQAEIDQIQWYHEFDFGGGLKARSQTEDVHHHRRSWEFIERQLDNIDFGGKTVLEIGTWDGYWSFYAERRGAKHVLASDDLTQNWANGQGLLLARELLHSRIEVKQDLPIYELSSLGRTFDVILCLGVYYHLLDPFHAFGQIRHCCHPGSLVVLEGDLTTRGLAPNEVRLYSSSAKTFLTSASGLELILKSAYLTVESQAWMTPKPRKRRLFSPRRPPVTVDRAVTICRPLKGENDCHPYEPPFGLKVYDSRFSAK